MVSLKNSKVILKKNSFIWYVIKKAYYVFVTVFNSITGDIILIRPINVNISKTLKGFSPNCKFFFSSNDKQLYIELINKFGTRNEIIQYANKICNHVFDLLGSGEVNLGRKIDWDCDFKSGFSWPKKYHRLLKLVDYSNNADVKVPWELSRFQHFSALGQAYWLTNDEKYPEEFKSQIDLWIEENPYLIGVNWACAMDIAIRAVNMVIAYYYFKDSQVLSCAFWDKYFQLLYMSGKYIEGNLECGKDNHGNNHYISDLIGLVWLGIFFKDLNKETKSWLKMGMGGLILEMGYQINPEGTDFEGSIPYHFLVTEMYLSTTIFSEMNGINYPLWYKERLEKMCEFIMFYTKPNGLSPQVGDADDGRLYLLSNFYINEKRDHRHILGIAGEYFKRPDLKYYAGNKLEDCFWLLKSNSVSTNPPDNSIILRSYDQMGYYIIRDNQVYIIIRCGCIGQNGMGGHSHNDQLSFELNILGNDIFIDPGTYVYTANVKERNKFRSTSFHNTLQIDNAEQNISDEESAFMLLDRTHSVLKEFKKYDDKVIFIGQHEGFLQKYGVTYTRKIIYNFKEHEILINDQLDKPINFSIYYLLDRGIEIVQEKLNSIILSNNIKVNFDGKCYLRDAEQSERYGVKCKTKKIVLSSYGEMTTKINYGLSDK